jgi:hypothetical protein
MMSLLLLVSMTIAFCGCGGPRSRHRGAVPPAFLLATLCLTFLLAAQLAFSGQDSLPRSEGLPSAISRRLKPAQAITEPYQQEALDALIREANQIARKLGLHEDLPIARTNLVAFFVLPRQGNLAWKAVGKIVTRNYSYYASKDNKFCYLERTSPEAEVAKWRQQYLWPISRMDTNAAYHLATQWLAAVSFDVEALNRDCRLRVQALTPQGRKEGARFLPLYMVYWVKGAEGDGSAASVQLFAPTQTLLQLRVEDPDYNLRRPLVVEEPEHTLRNPLLITNTDVLLSQTNSLGKTNARAE